MKKIIPKLSLKKIIRYANFGLFAAIAAVFLVLLDFLYTHVFAAAEKSKQIIILQDRVAVNSINMNQFNAIMKKYDAKISQRTPKITDSPLIGP